MAAQEVPDRLKFSLATLPPTAQQRKLALAMMAALIVAFAATAPFAAMPLPRIDAFIPALQAVIFVTDLITAILLFGQYSIIGTIALLVLASGYLFSALIVIPHALSFPGSFAPAGLFGGTQTTVWLYNVWHFGFPAAVFAYACLKGVRTKRMTLLSVPFAIAVSAVVVAGLVCAFAWAAAEADSFLPPHMPDDLRHGVPDHAAAAVCASMSVLALVVLWSRGRSILDLWLMVAVCAAITEPILTGMLATTRFSVGFYASRGYSVVASTVVLAVLLSETTILYATLSRTITLLWRERNSKLMNMEAIVASITHEVKQPLSAIAANGDAALILLDRPTPDLKEVREALNAIVQDTFNASQVFDNVRVLFRSSGQKRQPVDVNAIALGALEIARAELKEHGVTLYTDLTYSLPAISGHKGQLQEVVLNLIHNAIDAMDPLTERPKLLRVRTEQHGAAAVALSVEDTGAGIDPDKIDTVFDAFFTTKATGMGLGLAICRMIIERHGGRISVSSKPGRGTLFRIVLPINPDQPEASR